jgi:hypothetical protein
MKNLRKIIEDLNKPEGNSDQKKELIGMTLNKGKTTSNPMQRQIKLDSMADPKEKNRD